MDEELQKLLRTLQEEYPALWAEIEDWLTRLRAGQYSPGEIRALIAGLLDLAQSYGNAALGALAEVLNQLRRLGELPDWIKDIIQKALAATGTAAAGGGAAAAGGSTTGGEAAGAVVSGETLGLVGLGLIAALAWFGGLALAAGKLGDLSIRAPGSATPCDEKFTALFARFSRDSRDRKNFVAGSRREAMRLLGEAAALIEACDAFLRECPEHVGATIVRDFMRPDAEDWRDTYLGAL